MSDTEVTNEPKNEESANSTSELDALLSGAPMSDRSEANEDDLPEDKADEAENESEDTSAENEATEEKEETKEDDEAETDEYGNKLPPKKMYSEDEVNQRINEAVRERLSRLERNNPQAAQQAQQQAAKDFEYDENSSETWQQQLESFVEQTFIKMNQKQMQQAQMQREQRAQQEFEAKFNEGRKRYSDFEAKLSNMPITDAMLMASRDLPDPSAFLYRAATVAGDELKRIASLESPYAQMREMGRLEEKMKHKKSPTKAPRPGSRVKDDETMPSKESKEPTPDDLIAASEQRRLKLISSGRKR